MINLILLTVLLVSVSYCFIWWCSFQRDFGRQEKDIAIGQVYRLKNNNPYDCTCFVVTGMQRNKKGELWLEGEYRFTTKGRTLTAPTSMKAETLVLVYELDQ